MAVTYTYDGEMIRWYVLIDPENGVQYIVNDRGGCCPRVSYDGTIMGVWDENASWDSAHRCCRCVLFALLCRIFLGVVVWLPVTMFVVAVG